MRQTRVIRDVRNAHCNSDALLFLFGVQEMYSSLTADDKTDGVISIVTPSKSAFREAETGLEAALLLPRLNMTLLHNLQEMAGETVWADIRNQIDTDLESVSRALSDCGDDSEVVRAQTHVLMAVAGTVGGLRVQRLAELLNTLAHEERPSMTRLRGVLLDEMALLSQQLKDPGASA